MAYAQGQEVVLLRSKQSFSWLAKLAVTAMLVVSQTAVAQKPAADEPEDAASEPAVAQELILFARSDANVAVSFSPAKAPKKKLVLRAYGRVWGKETGRKAAKDKLVEGVEVSFIAPSVRVPTVFVITPSESPESVLGEVVVYPNRDIDWEKKIVLYAAEGPKWFADWARATGLPVTWLARNAKLPSDLLKLKKDQRALLILGSPMAGKDLSDMVKLWGDASVNVLVLNADWFGRTAGAVSVQPNQTLGGLAEIARQRWPQPLKFLSHRGPWPGIANRWAWVTGEDGLPLVEYVWPLSEKPAHPIVLSYAQWESRLGRSETADSVLLSLLSAAANAQPPRSSYHAVSICGYHGVSITAWPADVRRKGGDGLTRPFEASRPVLSTILNDPPVTDMGPQKIDILDLRGTTTLSEKERESLEKMPRRLLILGDDKILDEWKWLKLNRAKKTIDRPEVVWLSDDEFPPSKDNQIRLMLKLTELGVPLMPPGTEEKKE